MRQRRRACLQPLHTAQFVARAAIVVHTYSTYGRDVRAPRLRRVRAPRRHACNGDARGRLLRDGTISNVTFPGDEAARSRGKSSRNGGARDAWMRACADFVSPPVGGVSPDGLFSVGIVNAFATEYDSLKSVAEQQGSVVQMRTNVRNV